VKWFLRRAAAMIPAIALAAALSGSAWAQVQRPITVAVLNFSNSSGYGGALLGNRAAAAVEAQMIESGRYDVVKRELVTRTMEDLNLSFPLGPSGLTQLATRLEADSIVTGDVQRVVRDPKTNQVTVTLRLEMTDRSSGELVNGAVASGESGIRPDFSGADDVLLDEALNRAAFAAVRTMNDRILPEGTVFATSSNEGRVEALLNIGSNSGVRPGMEFIVLRNREQVGRLRATTVDATDSTAVVLSSLRGVQPEDKVRAVFRLTNISVEAGGTGASTTRMSRPKMKLSNVAIGALALFGLYRITQGNTGTGTPGVRNATAVSTGPNNGAFGANIFGYVPAVRVRWSQPIGVSSQDVVGYGVYRLTNVGTSVPVQIISGSTPRETLDDGRPAEVEEATGDDDAEFGSGFHPGLEAGVQQRYMIRTAYLERTTDDQGNEDEGDVLYADEVYSSSATAILPPAALEARSADGTDPTRVEFDFTLVPGADRYVIQVADNPGFTNPDTYPRTGELVYTPPPAFGEVAIAGECTVEDDGTITCERQDDAETYWTVADFRYPEEIGGQPTIYAPLKTVNVDLNTGTLDPPGPGRQMYWRIGARNSRDDQRPEGGGYVWGDLIPLAFNDGTQTTLIAKPIVPDVPGIARPTMPSEVDPDFSGMKPGAGRNMGRGR